MIRLGQNSNWLMEKAVLLLSYFIFPLFFGVTHIDPFEEITCISGPHSKPLNQCMNYGNSSIHSRQDKKVACVRIMHVTMIFGHIDTNLCVYNCFGSTSSNL